MFVFYIKPGQISVKIFCQKLIYASLTKLIGPTGKIIINMIFCLLKSIFFGRGWVGATLEKSKYGNLHCQGNLHWHGDLHWYGIALKCTCTLREKTTYPILISHPMFLYNIVICHIYPNVTFCLDVEIYI